MRNPNLGQPVKNKYHVPKKQWDKWHNLARRVFNRVYEEMRPSQQWVFVHPDAILMRREYWQTTRWNAAWTAAHAANGDPKHTKLVTLNAKGNPVKKFKKAQRV